VTANQLIGINEFFKISASVPEICGWRYIDSTKLTVFVKSLPAETDFVYFKGWYSFKSKKKYNRLNGSERVGD
jgi:hypothetical protein